MRVERHIFGSFTGYTTLAKSAGISAEDCRVLESGAYAFGQNHERSYMKSLSRQPAFFTRNVPGGRRGLTRVLEGAPDDNNRATLLMITAVINQSDWDNSLFGDLDVLLDDRSVWEWDQSSGTLSTLDIRPSGTGALPKKSVEKLLKLLSEVERAIAARRSLIVDESEVGRAELRALEMLVPPPARRQFATASRSLSPQLAVTVNSVANEAGAAGRVNYRSAGSAELSPYARTLAQSELAQGRIPLELIAGSRFSAPSELRPAAGVAPIAPPAPVLAAPPVNIPPAKVIGGGFPAWIAMAGGALSILVALATFFIGKSLGAGATLAAERARQEEQRNELEAAAEIRATTSATQAVALANAVNLEKVKKALDTAAATTLDESLTAAAARTSEVQSKLKETAAALAEAKKESSSPSSSSPAPAVASASLPADTDGYKNVYLTELRRQRARYMELRKRVEDIASVRDATSFARSLPDLREIEGSLATLADDWPAAGDDDRKWLTGLPPLRDRVLKLTNMAVAIERANELLRRCRLSVWRGPKANLAELTSDLDELDDMIRSLSAGPDVGVHCDVKGMAQVASAESGKMRDWTVEEQSRRAEKAKAHSESDTGLHLTPPPKGGGSDTGANR